MNLVQLFKFFKFPTQLLYFFYLLVNFKINFLCLVKQLERKKKRIRCMQAFLFVLASNLFIFYHLLLRLGKKTFL